MLRLSNAGDRRGPASDRFPPGQLALHRPLRWPPRTDCHALRQGLQRSPPTPADAVFGTHSHYQRFWSHKSHLEFTYVAGELSIPCPPGLSGGPLSRPAAPVITGMATENMDAYSIWDSEEITDRAGVTTRISYKKIITYGVSVTLYHIADWLKQLIPESVL